MIRYHKRRVLAKTGNYSINPNKGDFSGTHYTNRGAGAGVTLTLPNPTPALAETFYSFSGVADQNMTVAAPTGKAVVLNNAAATSLAASTAGQKIGARIDALCDGTSWLLTGVGAGFTYTVA